MIKLLKGNRKVLKYRLMVDGEDLENLEDATRVVFAVKDKREDADQDAKIFVEWKQADPVEEISLDDPDTGWVKVTLNSSVTAIPEGVYYFALQIEWFPEDKLEFIFGDGQLKVEPDVIR